MEDSTPLADIQCQGDITIVNLLHDELVSITDIQRLEETLGPMISLENRLKLIINFQKIRMMSSSALGFLLRTHKDLSKRQGRLILCCLKHKIANSPADTYVYELFKIVELNNYFEICESIADALIRIKQPPQADLSHTLPDDYAL